MAEERKQRNLLNEQFDTSKFELSDDGFTYLFNGSDEELITLTKSVDVFEFLRNYDEQIS